MERPLQILIAEDNPADVKLLLRALQQAGFEFTHQVVSTEEDYLRHLHPQLDIILSDYAMPQFGGLRALELLRERGLEIPFVIVSGTIGEDQAVSAMKQGAADYLLKDRMARLGPAVTQAIMQGRMRRESRKAEEALRLFRNLVDQSDDTFEVIDPETGRFLDVNAKGPAEMGCTREEYLSLRVTDIDPSVDRSAWARIVQDLRTSGSLRCEGLHRRKDGTSFPIEINAKWVQLDREYIVASVRNIAGRKEAEDELRKSESRFREQAAMLDRTQDAIIVRDFQDRRISFWSRGAETLYGWTVAEASGRDISDLICTDLNGPDGIRDALLENEEWRGETRHITKSGKKLIVNTRATLVRDDAGQPKSVLSINTDITEQKELEARFLRAQRMESIGTLASGVAHDLNNILAPIMMCAPILRRKLTESQIDDIVTTIEMSAERGAQIVKQVLTFGRGLEGERCPLQVTVLVKEMMKIMRETFPRNIALKNSSGRQAWPILGDATQIHQVLLNLCVNARDAMPEGGELLLGAKNLDLDASYASMLPDAAVGPHVLIEVSDTGSGIPPEVIERIFEPFFTTKGVGQGTGLGLSTVLGIVRSHGGFLHVESSPGKGTTFQVYLPAARDYEPALLEPKAAPAFTGHDELVLVVDDEASIRDSVRLALETGGYRVLVATDGIDALSVFAPNSATIALVLTDLMMPSMDGMTLIKALRVMAPSVSIIASTGLGEKAQTAQLSSLGVVTVLHKPFGADVLLQAVHDKLHPA